MSLLGDARLGEVVHKLLSGMIRKDFWFPESVLIQNEICEPESVEHLIVFSPPHCTCVAAMQLEETWGINALSGAKSGFDVQK